MFSRRSIEQHAKEKAARKTANLAALCQPSRSLHRGSYEGGTSGPAPKTEAYRDAALLEMARGRPCLLMVPGLCNHRTDTTVAAHANWSWAGKAGARRADDVFAVWCCANCHIQWLDQGKATRAEKEAAFMAAHARQVLAWRLVAMDTSEPERFRNAALRALEHLNATPITEEI